jgi:hypothetical protein
MIGADATPVNSPHVALMIKGILKMKTRHFSKTVVSAMEHITLA